MRAWFVQSFEISLCKKRSFVICWFWIWVSFHIFLYAQLHIYGFWDFVHMMMYSDAFCLCCAICSFVDLHWWLQNRHSSLQQIITEYIHTNIFRLAFSSKAFNLISNLTKISKTWVWFVNFPFRVQGPLMVFADVTLTHHFIQTGL